MLFSDDEESVILNNEEDYDFEYIYNSINNSSVSSKNNSYQSQHFMHIKNNSYESQNNMLGKNNSYESQNFMFKVKDKIQQKKIKLLEKKKSKLKYNFCLQELKYKNEIIRLKFSLNKQIYDSVLKELTIKNLSPYAFAYMSILKSIEGSPRHITKKYNTNFIPKNNYSESFLISVKNSIDIYFKKGFVETSKKIENYYKPYFEKYNL